MAEISGEQDRDAHWERVADEWIAWSRAPGHDAFWYFREQFRAFLPPAGASTLDLGCGEGRVSRELGGLGHRVTAVDNAPSLLAAARDAGSAERYALADAAGLPFPDGSFDRVVAYNMLMDVPDMAGAVREAARVLTADGVLTVSVVHPVADRGSFAADAADAPFVIDSGYFEHGRFTGTETRDGLSIHFDGWSYTLAEYVAALQDAGLAITALAEPRPAAGAPPAIARWQRMPLFLWITAEPLRR